MEVLIVGKCSNLFFRLSKILILFFCCGVICTEKAQAFFESQAKYDLEHRWLIMLTDNSSKNRQRGFLEFVLLHLCAAQEFRGFDSWLQLLPGLPPNLGVI